MDELEKSTSFGGPQGPVVLAILDGIGIGRFEEGDVVRASHTPVMDWLAANTLTTRLKAHGARYTVQKLLC